jgi:hypothetical protein
VVIGSFISLVFQESNEHDIIDLGYLRIQKTLSPLELDWKIFNLGKWVTFILCTFKKEIQFLINYILGDHGDYIEMGG